MRSPWSWCAASLLLAATAAPAAAATIVEKSVVVEIRPDGSALEHERLAVRIDTPGDLASWSPYPIYLDEHRKLEELAAFATTPEGRRVAVPRKDMDTVTVPDGWQLHSSAKYRTVTFPVVPPGSVLTVEHRVKEVPYFRTGLVPLGSPEPVERLRVEVRGAGPGWRWRIDGPRDGLQVQEVAGGVVLTAAALPRREAPELAPGDAERIPVLRYGWGGPASWQDVGRWYEGLLAQLPRLAEPVRGQARELTAGLATPREKLAALLAFAAKRVRYVAVEVGIGGYLPSPPDKVLERRWGDCKDKSLLLVDLLREAGLEAYPALVRLAADERIDAEFPSPDQFNHVIVAVRAAGVAADGDPVAGGFLFVDPTDEVGSVRWLHPGVQDQDALVVQGERSALVRTPLRHDLENRKLAVDLTVTPDGGAAGEARLELAGELGSWLTTRFATARPEETEHELRSLLGRLLPGVSLDQVRWSAAQADVPAATVSARLSLRLAPDGGHATSFSIPGLAGTPSPGLLQNRTLPLVLSPGADRVSWRLTLPDGWCAPKPDQQTVDNEIGEFRQTVAAEGRVVRIERALELRQRWIEPARFPALKELALADHRAGKRRVRLECGEGGR